MEGSRQTWGASSAGTEIEGTRMGTWPQGTEGKTERRDVPARLRKRHDSTPGRAHRKVLSW
ncbi:rCG31324 [Rattus norvegicus]|uniref:RCG31324 n=1 Tax=Rattus norvegicus TaxID=10116 RepID=A6IS60_RAT|nr:rCG31324 [Rattus norvegicus]